MASRTMALDCDGVLLDYDLAYAGAWQRAFGEYPREVEPQAYWPLQRWGVRRVVGEDLERFRAAFDERFWSGLPAIPGARQACERLREAGYQLACVTALPPHLADARAQNLRSLGFPAMRVVTTGYTRGEVSPKAAALAALSPVAFVDDYLPYLYGVDRSIHCALIMRGPVGTPNAGPRLALAHSQHADLAGFASWWLGRAEGLPPSGGPASSGA
jgi:hypothetical protein